MFEQVPFIKIGRFDALHGKSIKLEDVAKRRCQFADRILVVDQQRIHREIITNRDYDRISGQIMSNIHVVEAEE